MTNQEIADTYAGRTCFLNGAEAQIAGRKERFATIRELDGPLAAQFAWPTVKRIMEERNGRFKA